MSEDIDPLQLVCQDVKGEWLQDTDELPEASPTACADVGYHALFLFDLKAPSMRKGHVKERITEVSDPIIDNFISPPPKPEMISSTSDSVRSELVKRLTTRKVPEKIPTTQILIVKNEFLAIQTGNGGSTCQMPQTIITYVESVIKGFTDLDFDALDPDFEVQRSSLLSGNSHRCRQPQLEYRGVATFSSRHMDQDRAEAIGDHS